MARFVFIVPPLTGHVNPTLSIGAELLARGHEVAWISMDQRLESMIPSGGEMLFINHTSADLEEQETGRYLDIISKKIVYGVESIKFLYEEVLIPLNRHCYKGIMRNLERYKPDLVITDHEFFAGAIAAINSEIPYVTSVTAPAAIKVMDELPKVYEWEHNQIVALQKELQLHIDKSIACSPLLNLVFTSREFFGDLIMPSHYHFVGPVIHQRTTIGTFDWQKLWQIKGETRILITIGTTFDHVHKRSFFSKVIEAFGNTNTVVIIVSDPELFEEWPENFLVQSYVPQLELLPHLDAVVCHGGHNTVCETLTSGIPMVVIPIAYDQSNVAGRVVSVGAGLRLNFNRFKAKHLQAAVAEILSNNSYKQAAEVIQQSFYEAGGTARAADLLVNLHLNKSNLCLNSYS